MALQLALKLDIPLLPIPVFSEEDVPPKPPPASRLIVPHKLVPSEDEHVRGVSKRLSSGYAETIGQRKSMEDRITIFGNFRAKEDEDFFAVFDGHNGDGAAKYCAGRMHVRLRDLLEKHDGTWDPVQGFKDTFVETNQGLLKARTGGGTTAVVALFKGNDLFIANVGDSRAVISIDGKATRITTDHKPDLPLEKARIVKNGGWVAKGGITGTLTVSRSLGDFSYEPMITCEPDVFGPIPFVDENHQILILACDGLWDVVTDDEAVSIALTAYDPEDAAVKLRDTAFKNNSKDNISVLVIFFPHYVPPTPPENNGVVPDTPDEINQKKSSGSTTTSEKKPKRTKSSGLSISRDTIASGAASNTTSSTSSKKKKEKDNNGSSSSTTTTTTTTTDAPTSSSKSKDPKKAIAASAVPRSSTGSRKKAPKQNNGLTGSGGAVLETKPEKPRSESKPEKPHKTNDTADKEPEVEEKPLHEKDVTEAEPPITKPETTEKEKPEKSEKSTKSSSKSKTTDEPGKKKSSANSASKKRKHKTDKPPEKAEAKD